LERENEYERRDDDDIRSKTISYGRKKGITSREEKGETKGKDQGACNNHQCDIFIWPILVHTYQHDNSEYRVDD
jgi:hypothetical protein